MVRVKEFCELKIYGVIVLEIMVVYKDLSFFGGYLVFIC